MAQVSIVVFRDPEGEPMVVPHEGAVGQDYITKMSGFGYQHVRTFTETVPERLNVQKLLDLIEKNDDSEQNLIRILWSLTGTAYGMGKGIM